MVTQYKLHRQTLVLLIFLGKYILQDVKISCLTVDLSFSIVRFYTTMSNQGPWQWLANHTGSCELKTQFQSSPIGLQSPSLLNVVSI